MFAALSCFATKVMILSRKYFQNSQHGHYDNWLRSGQNKRICYYVDFFMLELTVNSFLPDSSRPTHGFIKFVCHLVMPIGHLYNNRHYCLNCLFFFLYFMVVFVLLFCGSNFWKFQIFYLRSDDIFL